jgi:hypothetical protein
MPHVEKAVLKEYTTSLAPADAHDPRLSRAFFHSIALSRDPTNRIVPCCTRPWPPLVSGYPRQTRVCAPVRLPAVLMRDRPFFRRLNSPGWEAGCSSCKEIPDMSFVANSKLFLVRVYYHAQSAVVMMCDSHRVRHERQSFSLRCGEITPPIATAAVVEEDIFGFRCKP